MRNDNVFSRLARGQLMSLTQEKIVFLLAVRLYAVLIGSFTVVAFVVNLLVRLGYVSVLGVLGLTMALEVVGHGIVLSVIASMANSVA